LPTFVFRSNRNPIDAALAATAQSANLSSALTAMWESKLLAAEAALFNDCNLVDELGRRAIGARNAKAACGLMKSDSAITTRRERISFLNQRAFEAAEGLCDCPKARRGFSAPLTRLGLCLPSKFRRLTGLQFQSRA